MRVALMGSSKLNLQPSPAAYVAYVHVSGIAMYTGMRGMPNQRDSVTPTAVSS